MHKSVWGNLELSVEGSVPNAGNDLESHLQQFNKEAGSFSFSRRFGEIHLEEERRHEVPKAEMHLGMHLMLFSSSQLLVLSAGSFSFTRV
ncbi:hypothetical protein KOW79_010948 [Hemibagrus wyckioides]|uniref:Uncharacterized protein n=1 Tax=Hemibagrus wyckioides TaxID=337641 RepID=A0A9D3NRK7_9TELE|nr:hypothetical protein KOW79_010948 [Hemibagrus wyckioides]